jgi:hypothetical protein
MDWAIVAGIPEIETVDQTRKRQLGGADSSGGVRFRNASFRAGGT